MFAVHPLYQLEEYITELPQVTQAELSLKVEAEGKANELKRNEALYYVSDPIYYLHRVCSFYIDPSTLLESLWAPLSDCTVLVCTVGRQESSSYFQLGQCQLTKKSGTWGKHKRCQWDRGSIICSTGKLL